jgi:RNA polymerase sigma factor (sigma-70 family)
MDHWLPAFIKDLAKGLDGRQLDELWRGYQAGTTSHALPVLIALHGPRVWRRCRAYLPYHDAQEVFSDTFRTFDRRKASIKAYAVVPKWLDSTAWRLAQNCRRKSRRKPAAVPVEQVATAPEAETDSAWWEAFAAALRRKPEQQRRALELVFFDGLTHESAAAEVGVPPGTVSSWVSRLKKSLGSVSVGTAGSAGVWAREPMPAGLLERTAREIASPRPIVAPAGSGRATAWKGLAAVVLAGVAAIGVAATGSRSESPDRGAAVAVPAVEIEETLAERNKRLLERDVIPKLLARLRSIPGAGHVKVVSCDAYDTRVVVVVEGNVVRELNPTVRFPLMRFDCDTHDGRRELWMKFHADGRWTRMDPPDRPRIIIVYCPGLPGVRAFEVELPDPHMDRAWAAFGEIAPDGRMAGEALARDEAFLRRARPWVGSWIVTVPGHNVRWVRWIRWNRQLGIVAGSHEWEPEWSICPNEGPSRPTNSLNALGGRLTKDGDRFGLTWTHPVEATATWEPFHVQTIGDARRPGPGCDMTGLWATAQGSCVVLHRSDGRIFFVDERDAATYGAVNSRGALCTGDWRNWKAMNGSVDTNFRQITWAGDRVPWSRTTGQGLTSIWYRQGADDRPERACAIIERSDSLIVVDEWDRVSRATLADGVVTVPGGREWGPAIGRVSVDGRRIDWESGAAWGRRVDANTAEK